MFSAIDQSRTAGREPTHSAPAISSGGASQLETKLQALTKQANSEFDALAGQQAELSSTSLTMKELSKQMKDAFEQLAICQKATKELQPLPREGTVGSVASSMAVGVSSIS